jgi:hypothetical protein
VTEASQLAWQSAEQSIMPGSHFAVQSAEQLAEQLASMATSHCPEQLASNLSG